MQQFTLGNLIGEGRYRRCFAVNEHPDLCAKTIKPTIEKQYFGRLKVTYPTRYYLLLQFGIADLNKLEWENVASLPQEMRMYAPPIVDLANNGDETGETMFVSSRAFDYDGTPSKTLLEHGPTSNAEFWKPKDADFVLFDESLHYS